MRGQWRGTFTATELAGTLTMDAEYIDGKIGGSVVLFPNNASLGFIVGQITPVEDALSPTYTTITLRQFNPFTNQFLSPEQVAEVFKGAEVAKLVQARIEWNDTKMSVSWDSDIRRSGNAHLTRDNADSPSELCAQRMSWERFKKHVATLPARKFVFRGQQEPWRLRSHFHRTGRSDLLRYVTEDMTLLYRHLSARTRHLFNRADNDQNGAFVHLAQHYGFPTPLIDWTYSPFVAAFFAYRRLGNTDAKRARGKRVRIFQFDQKQWRADFPQVGITAPAHPHFSLMEFIAIENERLIPQQALSGLTNVVDVETYIAFCERTRQHQYLTAIDLPVSERETVMRELALMGITAGSLFPGLDGACEELRERLFPT